MRQPHVRFTVRWMMVAVAVVAVALAAWILLPPWWQYHQSIRTLSG